MSIKNSCLYYGKLSPVRFIGIVVNIDWINASQKVNCVRIWLTNHFSCSSINKCKQTPQFNFFNPFIQYPKKFPRKPSTNTIGRSEYPRRCSVKCVGKKSSFLMVLVMIFLFYTIFLFLFYLFFRFYFFCLKRRQRQKKNKKKTEIRSKKNNKKHERKPVD